LVRVVRLERTVSWSQTRRDTNFAIPGYSLFCHDTTARGKNKDFSVCGHSCGQSRFCAVFCNRGKSSKRRCRKALRRFASPYPGYNHGTPKCRALPVEPHPDIHFSAMIPRRVIKIKFFLSVVIPVVKAAFMPLSAIGESPANAGVTRLSGVSHYSIPDTATALPRQARYQLRYTRLYIAGLSDRPHSIPYSAPVFKSFLHRRPTNLANPGGMWHDRRKPSEEDAPWTPRSCMTGTHF
jgi:hypothetical protein